MVALRDVDPGVLRIAGAGGHAKVVVDACMRAQPARVCLVSDDRAGHQPLEVLGLQVVAPLLADSAASGTAIHVALGSNRLRRDVALRAEMRGYLLESVLHPDSSIAASARIGAGSLVAARVVVAPEAVIGRGAILNHGAVVDHDCIVGEWAHIAGGAVLAGSVVVEEGALVGAGAKVLPGCRVGAWSVVGAGAVVVADVPAGATVVGVPARLKGKHE